VENHRWHGPHGKKVGMPEIIWNLWTPIPQFVRDFFGRRFSISLI
jgi:hypothetical protein